MNRAALANNPVAKRLFTLMEEKKTNLGLVADCTKSSEIEAFADLLGPQICLLKTHIDIVEDFTPELTKNLRSLADKHGFVLFEDRKFADIGHTVGQQYLGGIYRIADWAELTNAHIVAGHGTIDALQQVGLPLKRAALLLAQMSTSCNRLSEQETRYAVKLAESYTDFVIGFICQEKISDNPGHLHITPGVHLASKEDALGQQYRTPMIAIAEQGCDIILVGRGILQALDPSYTASLYREEAWEAFLKKTSFLGKL